ncbi:hypothetical protein, variant 2 [Aphanomyces astaci]|uniref:PH domain-containing protein n=1 Tax=Aphanomyces astaci TaxID=112090 RepID=W4GZK9_APHAT|nr:hypothetical protein, variant 2 [Aphanomyces astaci]ETV85165.1 hypothetical protein, variant 2 [Aphanomyces astaci]|eukprot:XP_009825183.1 hypothetical protein, variant 2 [Aphanomyces astaci]
MGNSLCCGITSYEAYQREAKLKEGDHFRRHTSLFGMLPTSDRIYLRLDATSSRLEWTLTDEPSDVARTEAIHVDHIAKIMPSGKANIILYAASGKKMLEVTAKDIPLRDLWVNSIVKPFQDQIHSFAGANVDGRPRRQGGHLHVQRTRVCRRSNAQATSPGQARVLAGPDREPPAAPSAGR